jgi:hypothetical protein
MARKKKKKSPAKKRAVKRSAKPARGKKPAAKRAKTKKTKARKAKTKARPVARKAKAARKAPARKKAVRKEVLGEGNYTASRNFREQETAFVKRNRSRIGKMGKEAEAALEGPEGQDLLAAEAEASGHSHTPDAQ